MAYLLASAGDILMGGPFHGPAGPCDAVRGVLGKADHRLVNLEIPLTDSR